MSYPAPQSSTTPTSSSASPQPSLDRTQPPQVHKRTYQACIPCRQRKVRCDLGSVEAPHSPPCVRCRRESKECYFSATRRKTRTSSITLTRGGLRTGVLAARGGFVGPKRESDEDVLPPPDFGVIDDMDTGSGSLSYSGASGGGGPRKKLRTESPQRYYPPAIIEPPTHPSSHSHHHSDGQHNSSHHNQQEATASTTRLLQGEVYNSHDALHLLFEAAGRSSSVPSSPNNKQKSEGEDDDNNDDDESSDDAGQVENERNGAGTQVNATHRDAASYPGRSEDADGRLNPIHPHHHYNGTVTSSTSYLRGTGRTPTPKPSTTNKDGSSRLNQHTQSNVASAHMPLKSPAKTIASGHSHSLVRARPSISIHEKSAGMLTVEQEERAGLNAALKAWGKSRFVKSGWFTAGEAINYID